MSFRQVLIGAVVGSGFLLFVYGAYFLVRRKEGLGMGDVTMLLVIGAFLGWLPTVLTLILASFAGAAGRGLLHPVPEEGHAVRASLRHLPRPRGLRRAALGRASPRGLSIPI